MTEISMTYLIPQYLRSDDWEVVAVAAANEEGRREFMDRADEFVTKYGVDLPHAPAGGLYHSGWGEYRLVGVSGGKPTQGKWKALKQGWTPFANDPIRKELADLSFANEPVPGLPAMVTAEILEGGGSVLWMFPTPFVAEGSVWVQLSRPGLSATPLGSQWVEVLGSQVLAAREGLTLKKAGT